MLTTEDIEKILTEYTDTFAPAMLQWRYHLVLAKGGPEYEHLPEQSMFAHIVNGVFGLAQFVRFLIEQRVPRPDLTETTFRRALALYSIHDVHKLGGYEERGTSQFNIPLERLRAEYERLELDQFADVDEYLMRAANVHSRSSRHGDVLLSALEEGSMLWLLTRIADTMASIQRPDEAASSLGRYFKRLGPAFAPNSPPGQFALYYHEIKDVRGILTNTIHEAVAHQLEANFGFFPLLYFATGTLYIGPATVGEFTRESFVQDVITGVLSMLTQYGSGDTAEAARIGLRLRRYDFEDFVYSFAGIDTLLEIAKERANGASGKIDGDIDSLLRKKELPDDWTEENVAQRLGMQMEQADAFMDHWYRARYYLIYVDNLLDKLQPAPPVEWFLENFPVSADAADNLRQIADVWAKGGFGKYVVPIAYHFLKGPAFANRSAEALPAEEVLDRLHKHVKDAMYDVDTRAGREGVVAELGFRDDLTTYLNEHLHLSFSEEAYLEEDALAGYSRKKLKSHAKGLCSICNRPSDKLQELRTGILDDSAQVFSNRMLPVEIVNGNRYWCPICHLEFILRKLVGIGLPGSADSGNSYRIYLYVLPTFSFTPDHLRLYGRLFDRFQTVTNVPVQDYGEGAPGAPRIWLERRQLDSYWVDRFLDILQRQSEWIGERGGRSFVGERVSTTPASERPHYYLIDWTKAARGTESNDARIATRTEAWAKAAYVASIITGLTACKVYVTERPYLPIADPAEMKPTILFDGPPPALRAITHDGDAITLYGREAGRPSGLEQAIDVSSALWVVNEHLQFHLRENNRKDKRVAERLGRVNTSPLAGATFYKEFARLNDGASPRPPLVAACEVLLEAQRDRGGELMDLVERIAGKSLEIALPRSRARRGKAHRYEFVFREGVSAMRKAQALIPEMRAAAVTGKRPSGQAVSELKTLTAGTLLKALERRQKRDHSDITVRAWGDELTTLTGEFVDILVDEVYLRRARGSFAQFLRLENSLADGIFYYTDRHLDEAWSQYKDQKSG